MHILGYLITLTNLQNFRDGGQVKDLTINMNQVHILGDQLHNEGEFPLDCFKSTNYCRVGSVGKFISTNVMEYLVHGKVNSNDEGLILTMYFDSKEKGKDPKIIQISGDAEKNAERDIAKFIKTNTVEVPIVHNNEVKTPPAEEKHYAPFFG